MIYLKKNKVEGQNLEQSNELLKRLNIVQEQILVV